ncbi:DUF4352 domain-containing protein [Streptomyces sp. NPDC052396]|uniref:DUF4352 domain-containing protein n=1 Tax=Streptomyces sp. NPDC052396 TaxID=3365689 RepID=UPI0037D90D2E
MRRQLAATTAIVALAFTATACNDNNKDDASKPAQSASADKSPATGQSSAAPEQGKGDGHSVGGSLTLKGNKPGEQLSVTLKNFADPAKASNKFLTPTAGKRWVAAQFELVNTGTAAYSDSPALGAKLIDTQGQSFTFSMAEIAEGPTFPGSVKLGVGDKSEGWVVFSVPENTKPAKVQYTPDSGFAKDTAEWNLGH